MVKPPRDASLSRVNLRRHVGPTLSSRHLPTPQYPIHLSRTPTLPQAPTTPHSLPSHNPRSQSPRSQSSEPPYRLQTHATPSLPPCNGRRAPGKYRTTSNGPAHFAVVRLPTAERQRRCRLDALPSLPSHLAVEELRIPPPGRTPLAPLPPSCRGGDAPNATKERRREARSQLGHRREVRGEVLHGRRMPSTAAGERRGCSWLTETRLSMRTLT